MGSKEKKQEGRSRCFLQYGQEMTVAAPAKRYFFSGDKLDAVAVPVRGDRTDIGEIHNITVVASEKQFFRKLFNKVGDPARMADHLIFIMKDQMAVLRLRIAEPGIEELEMTVPVGYP